MEQHKNNRKKSWNILKEVINKKKSNSVCSRFIVNDAISTDKYKIADGFNSFFTNYWRQRSLQNLNLGNNYKQNGSYGFGVLGVLLITKKSPKKSGTYKRVF